MDIGATIACCICLAAIVMAMSHGSVIKLEDENSVTLKDSQEKEVLIKQNAPLYSHDISVQHFAIHGLCKHYKGQKHFYTVMKSKLCKLKDVFVANFVMDICSKRNAELFKWVAELFDIDGDGHISYFEKNVYQYDE